MKQININSIICKWNNEIAPFLQAGNAIFILSFTSKAEVLFANNSMSFIDNDNLKSRLINPSFESITSNNKEGEIFSGVMTLGDPNSNDNISIIAKIFKKNDEYLVAGELDIQQIMEQNKAIYSLNTENANLNRLLQKEKKMLELAKSELIISEAKLKEINATKDKFFSIIAHDLRSPFSAFLSLSSTLATEYKSISIDDLHQISDAMLKSANSVYNLLNELLLWSRSQMGNIPFNPEELDLYEIIYNNSYLLGDTAKKKNIEIEIEASDNLITFCDRNMIMTVFRNLLNNAIKFSFNNQKIILSCVEFCDPSIDDNKQFYKVSVQDFGMGISPRSLQNLFKVGETISTQGTDGEVGTGLGLILCREFIERHDGRIWVESELDSGSTFSFIIPKLFKIAD